MELEVKVEKGLVIFGEKQITPALFWAEGGKEVAMAGYKDEIESYQLVARTSGRKVATGFEMRDIPCTKTTDYRKGEVVIIRNDTGEMVETRKIRDSERQMDLL